MAKLRRQVTPPAWRIWTFGVLATAVAALANYGWLYLCNNVFNWNLLVPKTFGSTELVTPSDVRVILATSIGGLVGTFGANLLAKSFIGPKIWWLLIGFGFGFASIYFVFTLQNIDLTVRLGLTVMHLLAMFIIVIPIGWALEIQDSDLASAVTRYSEHLDSRNPKPETTNTAEPDVVHTEVLNVQDVANSVIGLDATDAIEKIETLGLTARITKRDAEVFTVAYDFREDRINLEVVNGTVDSASIG